MIEQLQRYCAYGVISILSLICIVMIQIGANSIKSSQINIASQVLENTYTLLTEISSITSIPDTLTITDGQATQYNEFQELMKKSSPVWHKEINEKNNIPLIKYKISPSSASTLSTTTPKVKYSNGVVKLSGFLESNRHIEIELHSEILENSLHMIDKYSRVLTITTVIIFAFAMMFIYVINRQKTLEHQFMQSKKNMENQVHEDTLTKMPNRRKFDKALDDQIFMAQHYDYKFSLVILDIDHFKKVNDTFGHKSGDEVLKNISGLIKSSIRHSDISARWGGEEFAIILSGADINMAVDIVEKLRQKIEQLHNEQVGSVTSSFGVCEYSNNLSSTELFARADSLLYKAKNSGRNRVEYKL